MYYLKLTLTKVEKKNRYLQYKVIIITIFMTRKSNCANSIRSKHTLCNNNIYCFYFDLKITFCINVKMLYRILHYTNI